MSKSILTAACFALVCVAGSLSTAATASAARYGSFVLHNPTDRAINYEVSWGNGDWTSYTVGPDESAAEYYNLDSDGRCPTPHVRFDCVGGDDRVTYLTFDMDVFATNVPDDGKDYVFRYTSDGRFINLFEE